MRSKLLLSIFTWFSLSTVFHSEQHCFPSITYSFQCSFHVSNLIQTFQTDWVESSTQSSLVIQNSFSVDYPVSCHEDSSIFKNIDGGVEKGDGDVSSVYGFLKATLSHNVMVQVTLIILMGILKRVMLVVDVVLWTSILIYNRMIWNHWWMIMLVLIYIYEWGFLKWRCE